MLDLKNYKKNRVEKLDAVTTGVSIERRHKVFIDKLGLNLSAVVRDALDILIAQNENENKNAIQRTSKYIIREG